MGTTADKLNKLKDTKARIKAAIEAKGVSNVGDVFGEYPNKIAAIPSGGGGETKWTGHADAEGLKAIGWTDEDIQFYQEHGVNWNEEDDEYHKVPQSNIELYGVINENNVQTYKDILVFCPKFEITKADCSNMFNNCVALVAIPLFDTSNVKIMNYMFYQCFSLIAIPLFNTSNVSSMNNMFYNCYSLIYVSLFDTSNITSTFSMFNSCYSLTFVPSFNVSKVSGAYSMFKKCYSLINFPLFNELILRDADSMLSSCTSIQTVSFDASNLNQLSSTFNSCYSIQTANIKGLKASIDLSPSALLSKESVLYIINNSIAESPITITLKQSVYDAMSADAEVQAALEAKPNVSLAGK